MFYLRKSARTEAAGAIQGLCASVRVIAPQRSAATGTAHPNSTGLAQHGPDGRRTAGQLVQPSTASPFAASWKHSFAGMGRRLWSPGQARRPVRYVRKRGRHCPVLSLLRYSSVPRACDLLASARTVSK
jgi:hypothetical protein